MTLELPTDMKGTLRRILRQMAILDRRANAGAASGNPTGVMQVFAGASAPPGWLMCDGAAISRTLYEDLFVAIGTRYGAGNGTTTFNLPNTQGATVVGYDPAQTEFNAIGKTGGAKTVALTVAQLAAHTHVQDAHNHTQNAHTHVQNAHNHTQDAHTHVQNSHNHTQNSHNHTQNPHTHTLNQTVSAGGGSTRVTSGPGPTSGTSSVDVQDVTATNNATTATNIAATAVNQNATATNQATTAVNQNATATNNAATAVNQSTGSGAAHNNLQPFIALPYIIKT